MVEDKFIIGQSSHKIDSKGRLSMPSYAKEDTEYAIKLETFCNENSIRLYPTDTIDEEVKFIQRVSRMCRTNEERIEMYQKFRSYCKKIQDLTKFDAQGRITLSSYLPYIDSQPGDYVDVSRLDDSIIVRKRTP